MFKNLTKPYLIGEIGINHNGDIDIAKRLIDAAYATQWDSVKFQKRNPDVCVPEAQKKSKELHLGVKWTILIINTRQNLERKNMI